MEATTKGTAAKGTKRAKAWAEGTAMATRGVLAGAYKGAAVEARITLSHAVLVDGEGDCTEAKTVCRRVHVDRLVDVWGMDGDDLAAPTCPVCAERAAR